MKIDNLEKILLNEPKYRIKQAKKDIFVDFIGDWQEATVLPLALREKLNQTCSLEIKADVVKSAGGQTAKALLSLEDGLQIETVLMKHRDGRNTVCLSSQVGCALGCVFCATGEMGFKRNLTAWEIVEQALLFARYLKNKNEKINNIVLMGMGEPFLNYDNVLQAIKIMNNPEGMNIGARHFSISTVGITEGIRKLAKENLAINLAISLHAPNDEKRIKLIPSGKKYNIRKIMSAVDYYLEQTNRRVMFEYLLIAGVNDSERDAEELAALVKRPLCFVNLIAYNSTGKFRSSDSRQRNIFKRILSRFNISVTERRRFGREIKGACGQLASK